MDPIQLETLNKLVKNLERFNTELPGFWFTVHHHNTQFRVTVGVDSKGRDYALLQYRYFDDSISRIFPDTVPNLDFQFTNLILTVQKYRTQALQSPEEFLQFDQTRWTALHPELDYGDSPIVPPLSFWSNPVITDHDVENLPRELYRITQSLPRYSWSIGVCSVSKDASIWNDTGYRFDHDELNPGLTLTEVVQYVKESTIHAIYTRPSIED